MKPFQSILLALTFGCLVASAQEPPSPVPDPIAEQPIGIVVIYTRSPCEHCERWKREVRPHMKGMGFAVVERITATGTVPRFEITIVGYQRVSVFRRLAEALRADRY